MNILHVVASNQRRGAETFGVELGAELERRGHSVDVVAVAPSAMGPHHDVDVAGRSRLDPAGIARLAMAARRHDVVVSFGSTSLQSVALTATLARRPFIYRNIGDPSVWGEVRWADLRIGTPLRRAAAVVAVFPAARETMVERYRLRSEQVLVIPRGVPADRFPVVDADSRSTARRDLGLDERPWIVFIGSLSEEKRPLAAVDAVLEHPHAGLLVCGDGPLADRVRSRAAGTDGRVRVLGPVDDVRVPIAAADALLLTSRTEGVPGVAIEAGLSGLPVIAPRVGGLSYVVADGATGLLVDEPSPATLSAAITTALATPQLGTAAAARCRATFSMEAVATAWEQELSAVVSGRPPSGTP